MISHQTFAHHPTDTSSDCVARPKRVKKLPNGYISIYIYQNEAISEPVLIVIIIPARKTIMRPDGPK